MRRPPRRACRSCGGLVAQPAARWRVGGPVTTRRSPPGGLDMPLVYTRTTSRFSVKVFRSVAVNQINDGYRRFFVRARQC
jgi:hypothetical protein